MPEPSIHRTATRSDLPQIVEIYNSTIPSRIATADTEPVSVESRVNWFEEHTPNRRPLWVVEDAGRVVAWLSFSSFYGRPAYAKTAELSVYVHEAFRKRGFGSYLLTQALADAPAFEVDTLLGFRRSRTRSHHRRKTRRGRRRVAAADALQYHPR